MLKLLPHVGLEVAFAEALRTEDIKFSPSGRVLAVVATSGQLFLFAVDASSRPVRITRHAELNSPSFSAPHGLDFVSEDVVAVANRNAWVTFHRLPEVAAWKPRMTIQPIHEMGSTWFAAKGATRKIETGRTIRCGPGSVRVRGDQLFVCCNNHSTVTAHPFAKRWGGRFKTGDGAVVAQAGLEIPDGVAVSRDGRWIAVSEHQKECILLYRAADHALIAELRDAGLRHPHGLCFDQTGRALYVADSGERSIHVFVTTDDWTTKMDRSTFSLPAVDEAALRKTKESVGEMFRPLEGGIKGIDLDPTGRVIATTCQNQMLRFFEADQLPA